MNRALLVLAVVLGACRASPPHATAVDAQRANVQLAELVDGRKLMVTKCGNCHPPPLPRDQTASEWPHKLDDMAQRANLDPRQRFLIQQYFLVMARR